MHSLRPFGPMIPAAALVLSFCGRARAEVTGGPVAHRGLELGEWYCIGPLKDAPIGLHLKSFDHVFPPEKQAVEAGDGLIDLAGSWPRSVRSTSKGYPTWKAAYPLAGQEPVRGWEKRPEWVDGYLNYLPFGPPPMRNETCYVYRTITAPRRMAVEMRIYALDNIRAWLNGTVVGQAMNPDRRGASRFAASLVTKLNLKAGANRLFVKITSMHGKRGFSFAMPPFTPSNGFVPGRGIRSVRPRDDALTRLREFRFDVSPIPMYDPARLRMAEELEKNVPGTPEGEAYLRRLTGLRKKLRPALDLLRTSSPGAGDPTIVRAAKDMDEFWAGEIRRLPPVAFLKCPPHRVNAIAPITTGGTRPSSICVLDPSAPAEEPRVIYHDPRKAIFDVNISYDAKTLLFSASGGAPGGWHIYEIGVDGKRLGQITDGNCSDMMPVLLPNDEVMFVSDRAGTVVVCQPRRAGILYVCNRDGSNVRRVSGNTLSDHTPQVMNDGRVLFTRWDYGVDKNVFCRQNLWTMNPDGTRFQLFGSNTKEDPNAFWKAQPIPGRPEVVCVFGPHHNYHAGMIGLVWDRPVGHHKDLRGEGFRWVTRELPTFGDTTLPWGYRDPFPVHEHLFLVSYGGDGGRKNRLYLLDDLGNRKLIHEAEGKLGCFHPLPLGPRRRPPVIPPQCNNPEYVYRDPYEANVDPDEKLKGTFLLQDVYEGLRPHVGRGAVKVLQIIEQVPKTQYVGGDHQGYAPTIGRGTMFVRRVIGTVPVETDGSAHFTAPAIRDISFNALDAEGRVIRRMGSTIHVMPGETLSCVGCHETRGTSPPARKETVIAARRSPSVPRYPPWTEKGIVEFTTVVQPVLDKYCIKCHGGRAPKAALDLSGDKTRFFSMAYDSLLDRGAVDYINMAGTGHDESTARDRGAIISKIRKHIETDVCCKPLPLEDRQRIYTWIDASVPYYGTYNVAVKRGIGARDRWFGSGSRWFEKGFDPVFKRRCVGCHKRTIRHQTYNYNSSLRTVVTSTVWKDQALSQFGFGRYRSAFYGPDYRINLTHPEWSQMLTAPLSKKAGGMELCKARDGTAVFKDANDPDYKLMLAALRKGNEAIMANPRVDMPEALKHRRAAGMSGSARAALTGAAARARSAPRAFDFRKDGWISRNATYEASSIIPKWSRDKEKLLTGEPYENHWAVCTEKEEDPWLIIFLPEESDIAEVDIVNRFPDCREFARTLTMWLSTDRKSWKQVWRAPGIQDRWLVNIPGKERARYIKLGLREKQYLDLKYVFVYGSARGPGSR